MAEKKIQTQYFQVKAPFFYKNDQLFTAGMVVEAGHPVLKGRQNLFQPMTPVSRTPAPHAQPAVEAEPELAVEADAEPTADTDQPS